MADPLIVHGTVKSITEDSLAGYGVTIYVTRALDTGGATVLRIPTSAGTRVGADGAFRIEVEAQGVPTEPITVVVSAPQGIEVFRDDFTLEAIANRLSIETRTVPPFNVTLSGDPTFGQRLRITGHVIDERGRPVPASLPVVIWGVDRPDGGPELPERPLIVSETQANGQFSGDWPAVELVRAVGRVSGGPPVPVPLDLNGGLIRQILLVINLDDIKADRRQPDASCDCNVAPPRAPDPADLTANPAAFSQDLNGGCVDLTTPNRALEEFSYFLVVRTSEPSVKGVTLGVPAKGSERSSSRSSRCLHRLDRAEPKYNCRRPSAISRTGARRAHGQNPGTPRSPPDTC